MSAPIPPEEKLLHDALESQDPLLLSRVASDEDLHRLLKAEEVLELREGRKRRNSRMAAIATAMVGYVALAGFFANAYQNWNNKKEAEARAAADTKRWEREFDRAQDADKYRAFFETSALATDATNADKRLVGYALLKEFVVDDKYNSKATFMLEESLALELRGDLSGRGLDDQHRLAIVAILSALSQTSDCRALAQAARSVEKLVHRGRAAARRSKAPAATPDPGTSDGDLDDMSEVFELYVRSLVGRAALVCSKAKDFREVRRPIRELALKVPGIAGLKARPTASGANLRIGQLLREACDEEEQSSALTDCVEIKKGYAHLCAEMSGLSDGKDEDAACQIFK